MTPATGPPTPAPAGEAALFWLQRQAVLCRQITPLLTLQFSPLPLLEISLILALESWPQALKPFLFICVIYLKCIHTEILQLVPPFKEVQLFTCSSMTALGLGFFVQPPRWIFSSLSEVGFHHLLRVYVLLNMALNFWNSISSKEQKDQEGARLRNAQAIPLAHFCSSSQPSPRKASFRQCQNTFENTDILRYISQRH